MTIAPDASASLADSFSASRGEQGRSDMLSRPFRPENSMRSYS